MAKYKKWDDFKLDVSAISKILTIPNGYRDLTKSQVVAYAKLVENEKRTEKQDAALEYYKEKRRQHLNHPLSATAKSYLLEKYGQLKYTTRTPAKQKQKFNILKGVSLEKEAIKMVSDLHGIEYVRPTGIIENDFLKGRADCICINNENLVELKIGWDTRSYFSNLGKKLDPHAWFQTQGYLELYDFPMAKVCYCLLNSPEHLVQQAMAEIYQKYCFGLINYSEYQEKMEEASAIYDYGSIPLRRRVITYEVHRHPPIIDKVKRLLPLCKDFLNEIEVLHIDNKIIVTSPEDYAKSEENNTESDSTNSRESDTGGQDSISD